MKFFKQSVMQSMMALSGFMFTTAANAYGLVLGPDTLTTQIAPVVTPIPEPSILSLVVVGVIAVGLSRRKSRR